MIHHTIGHKEFRLFWPAIKFLRSANLIFAKWFAVCSAGVFLRRGSPTNSTINDDQRWTICRCSSRGICASQHIQIVRIGNAKHIPSISQIARAHIIVVCKRSVTFDGDVIVVVNPAKIRELQMSSQTGGFSRNSFHHATIAADRPDSIIEKFKSRSVVSRREPTFGHCHTNACRETLAQRTGCRFDAARPVIFRMSRATRIELTKTLDVFDGQTRLASQLILGIYRLSFRQIQQGIEQHSCVPIAQYKSISAWTKRIRRIESQEFLPKRVRHWSKRHRCSRMPRLCSLDCIHRKRADRIDAECVDFRNVSRNSTDRIRTLRSCAIGCCLRGD